MEKKYFIFGACLILIAVAGFLGLKNIQQTKKNISISNELLTVGEQKSANSNQGAAIDQQPTGDSSQEVAVGKVQKTNNEQSSKSDKQNAVENSPVIKEVSSVISNQLSSTDAAKQSSSAGKIVSKLVSWGFQKSSERKIDTIILHSSYDALGSDPFSVAGVIAEYKQAQVSPHYLITRDGTIYQLVADQNIAWHAGVAKMPDGRTDVNSFSIGIEMINTQTGKFTDQQYSAVNRLIGDLKNKYPIKNILGHSDIASGRKTDPWGIEWKKIQK
ncbi:MAG: N-acetylmuramoyl-L-alanine amidase [Candidatus Moraniibacteriota bacterium]